MKRFSIHQQVAWLSIAPLLVMAISLESFFLHDRFASMDQDLLERGELLAHQLASSSEYGVFSNNQVFLQDLAKSVMQQPDVHGVAIFNMGSTVLASEGKLSSFTDNLAANSNKEFAQFKRLKDDAFVLPQVQSDTNSLRVYHPITPAQIELGNTNLNQPIPKLGAVVVEINKHRIEELKARMLWMAALATILFLSIAFYLVYRAGLSITRPIRKLSEAVQTIGQGDLSTPVTLQTSINEFATLARGMNEMTALLLKERTILQQRIDEATQELRAKKERAEDASQDKSRFLAVASHDLRQPLHALGLYVAELQHRVTNDEQRHLVGQIEKSTEALSALLNALLDISKLDARVIIPQMQTCSLNVLLKRISADYQMLAGIKHIRLITRPCTGYVTSDTQLLERILTNLVSNAIRYTAPNGCVMVACRRRGDFWRIEVRDNGLGISKIDQINIFREFFQLPNPLVNTEKGLGLGLSIVDRLVKLLGHRLTLRSESGKGSVFAVEIPATNTDSSSRTTITKTTQSNGQAENGTSPLAGVRILVVDDDPAVLSGTSRLMASWGCIVNSAASMAEVEQLLQDGKTWDFIISDYQLNDENASGIEVIAAVRQHQKEQVSCVLISGDTSQAVLKLASVSGHHLLHKPVKPAKLRSLILHSLNKGSSEDEGGE